MNELKNEFLKKSKILFWDICGSDLYSLSDEAIFERIFMYGDLEDLFSLIKLYKFDYSKEIYKKLLNKKRVNLSKKTVNFLNIVFSENINNNS